MKIGDFSPLALGATGGIMTVAHINGILTMVTLFVGLVWTIYKFIKEVRKDEDNRQL